MPDDSGKRVRWSHRDFSLAQLYCVILSGAKDLFKRFFGLRPQNDALKIGLIYAKKYSFPLDKIPKIWYKFRRKLNLRDRSSKTGPKTIESGERVQ